MPRVTGILLAMLVALPAAAQTGPIPAPHTIPGAVPPGPCSEVYQPVCAKKEGHPKSYVNECRAREDGATDVKSGHCSPGQ